MFRWMNQKNGQGMPSAAIVAVGLLVAVSSGNRSLAQSATDLRRAAESAMPATVNVRIGSSAIPGTDKWIEHALGWHQSLNTMNFKQVDFGQASSRTGFAIANDLIVTLNVPAGEELTLTVGGQSLTGDLVARDLVTGLAIVRVEASDILSPLEFSDQLPATGLPVAITWMRDGKFAALDAAVVASDPLPVTPVRGFTQLIDADVDRRALGAPIVDVDGKLVGVVTMNDDGSVSALPVSHVQSLIAAAKADEAADLRRGRIGIALGNPKGAIVSSVSADTPAQEAGIVAGDRVLRVGQYETTSQEDVLAAVAMSRADDEIAVSIDRDGETLEKTLKLAGQSAEEDPFVFAVKPPLGKGNQAFRIEKGKLVPLGGDGDAEVPGVMKWQDFVVPFDPKRPQQLKQLEVERSELEKSMRELEAKRAQQDRKLQELTDQLKRYHSKPDEKPSIEVELKRLRALIEKINRQVSEQDDE